MRSYTHIAGAMVLFLSFAYLVNLNCILVSILFAGWISVFPDILDNLVGNHRGIGHSIFWLIPFALLGFWNTPIAIALMMGFISHIFLDILTTHGCPVLYPIWKTNFVVLNQKRRIKTGTKQDKAVFLALIFLLIPIIFFTVGATHTWKCPFDQNFVSASTEVNDNKVVTNDSLNPLKSNINLNFQLNPKTNKNLTVKKINDNETTVIVKDIEPGG
jgi:inner membrane protein